MVAARQAFRSLIFALGLIALVLVGLNLTDEDLKPEVQEILHEHPPVSSAQRFFLGTNIFRIRWGSSWCA